MTVKWLVAEEGADIADQLAASGEELHAPRLMASEVANALWRKERVGLIERVEAGAAMTLPADMPVRWAADETVGTDAVRLALTLDDPVYDCVHLAPAHRIGAIMLTANRRFVNAIATIAHGEAVVTLAEFAETR